ncbi:hypothetical protein ACBQ19_03465 [Hafnia alvei]
MPILFFMLLGLVITIFWDSISDNVVVIGSIATALAFFATSWAAWEARSSTKAALKAVRLTSDSLFETKKSSFKQWFELLLEKNDELSKEVFDLLQTDNSLKPKLERGDVRVAYYAVSKKPLFIKYCNHILMMLRYIDKEFYIQADSNKHKAQYIDYLRNAINSDVKLIIALFGIKVVNNDTFNSRELSFLLNKYNFFDNELFFSELINNPQSLEHIVNDSFDKLYRENIMNLIKDDILKDKIIDACNYAGLMAAEKLFFVILFCYKTPCRDFINKRFDLIGEYIKNEIRLMMERASDDKAKAEGKLSKLIGYTLLSENKLKHRSGVYQIKTQNDVISLVDHYISNVRRNKRKILLADVYFRSPAQPDILGWSLEGTIESYCISCFFLSINGDEGRFLAKVSAAIDEMVEYYKGNLENYKYS